MGKYAVKLPGQRCGSELGPALELPKYKIEKLNVPEFPLCTGYN